MNTTQDLHFDCTGKTILIVEDEKELREYLIESFTETFKKFMQQTMQSRHWKHAERNNRLSL